MFVFAKGKKDVYIFIFLSSFVLLEIKIFIIYCSTFESSYRCDSPLCTSCWFWEVLSVSSSAAAAWFCSQNRNGRSADCRRCSSSAGARWWCHKQRNRSLCNTRHRRRCVWDAVEVQADVGSPVCVQVPPQVPDGLREAHFQYEHAIPIFWLYLQGEDVGAGSVHPVNCFHWVFRYISRILLHLWATQSIWAL